MGGGGALSQRCDILGMNGISLYQFQRMPSQGMATYLTLARLEMPQTGQRLKLADCNK